MAMVVRLAAGEWQRLRETRLRALRDTPDAFGATFEEAACRSSDGWAQQLRDLPTFIAVSDGRDVGMARYAADEKSTDTAWLISMWVAPEARRMGIGAALVDAVIDCAHAAGMKRLLLDVADHNAPAVALYARKGFQPTGETGTLPPPRDHIREHRRELALT